MFQSVEILQGAHRLYLDGIGMILRQIKTFGPENSSNIVQNFRRDLHAIITNSVTDKLAAALKSVLRRHASIILGLPSREKSRAVAL